MPRPVDHRERRRALDPTTSFIVQAPAGSGKTGLLSQRFIVLLASVEAPEEIVAITFTRKAAAEMRQRILQALQAAQSDQAPDEDYARQTWELARRALARDRELGWDLLQNPARLRIQTIDSLCTSLVRQMPVSSGLGMMPAISEDPDSLYRQAAADTLGEIDSREEWSDSIAHLAAHLDNQLPRLQQLLADMLAQREQWLRLIARPDDPALTREQLEAAFAHLVEDAQHDARRALQASLGSEAIETLLRLARFAGDRVDAGRSPAIAALKDLDGMPASGIEQRRQWLGLAQLLLTTGGAWRKRLNIQQGFPPESAGGSPEEKALFRQMKQQITALLQQLEDTAPALRLALADLLTLPPHHYRDEEWQTLQALIRTLQISSASLQLVFAEKGEIDFPALARAALDALGDDDRPTDLALALDYRIRHLLVDEFQDTSLGQYELLRRLTAGWQPGDGRSLFVVGDPMQSIYRFREAEVGLFIDACEYGIGEVPLEFLRLRVNFRSQQGIIDWVNTHFAGIMPAQDHAPSGAVAYVPSVAWHASLPGEAVRFHASLENDARAEAAQVVELIRQSRQQDPQGSIAVIVRSRSHLVEIIAQLQQAGLAFQAVDIEHLSHRPVIQDLLSLTRALLDIGDRIAWLAILRAPFCGLTLRDLHALVFDDHEVPVIELLAQAQRLQRLSEAGQQCLQRVWPLLRQAVEQRHRDHDGAWHGNGLRRQVEGLWLALGGPACVASQTDLEDAQVFLQLLDVMDDVSTDVHELEQALQKLYALPDVKADGRLQLMSIHKAKGLEFDTVILPGLGKRPRSDSSRLLHWLERRHDNGSDLLLAPIHALGDDRNAMVACLQQQEKLRARYEDTRLLYVAATRARKRLHLFAHAQVREQGAERRLGHESNSLLARLWPMVEPLFEARLADWEPAAEDHEEASSWLRPCPVRRLPPDWCLPSLPPAVELPRQTMPGIDSELLEFDWAGEAARHIGTVVHRLLQNTGGTWLQHRPDSQQLQHCARQMLRQTGLPLAYLDEASTRVVAAVQATLEDERGRWLLDTGHRHIEKEKAVSVVVGDVVRHKVIDLTFVDGNDVRWIVDYKTGRHTGGGVDEFLAREVERYRPQLEGYAQALRLREQRPIKLALYYPLLPGWREWDYTG